MNNDRHRKSRNKEPEATTTSFSTPSTAAAVSNDTMRSPSNPTGVELPIKMSSAAEIDESLENADSALRKYGWLYKLSQNGLKLWKKRYFVLTDYILDYYSGKL